MLERRTEAFGLALSGRVQAYIDTLPGLRQFGVLRRSPTDLEFRQYVQAISLQRRFPGLALTFFADRVQGRDLPAYVDAVRGDRSVLPEGHPEYLVRPLGERSEYMVIRHLYPFDSVTFGYDLYDATQNYRPAVERAISSGSTAATGPILLARDRSKSGHPELTSVVIRMPLYESGAIPPSVASRIREAQGVVGISFRTAELVSSALPPELRGRTRILITDVRARAENENSLVFDSAWTGTLPSDTSAAGAAKYTVDVADRSWEIAVIPESTATFFSFHADTWLLLGLAALLAASSAAMTRTLVNASWQAEIKVQSATAQLLAERNSLEKSERKYRLLFETSQEAMLRTRPDGVILAANPAALQLFGWGEEQMRQLSRSGLIDESDPRLLELLRTRERSGRAHGLIRMIKSDGTRFEAEVTSSVYQDSDAQPSTSVMIRDVTERQHAIERQAMLTAILDATPDFVGSADVAGGNIFLNRAWRRLIGRGESEDVSSLRVEDCHPPWACRIVLEHGMPTARSEGVWSGQTALVASDGSELPVSQVIICHRDARGEVTHFSTVARDLTFVQRAEAERRALEAQLRESQKMESIGTLAGGVAHDFNNVLAAILGNAALAIAGLEDGQPIQENLARIKLAASRARTLVQQILTFSRRTTLELTLQPLGPLVEEAVLLLRSTLPPTVDLRTVITEQTLFVLADAAQIQQVVMNLCTNAWQALPEGRGTIEVALEAIDFGLNGMHPGGLKPGRYARLRIKDDGVGMDAATQQRVFEPFFTTKRVGEGTGLGLAVVHGIVTAGSGAITIDSVPGSGSNFDVYLPLHDAPKPPDTVNPQESEAPTGRGERILYVDDDEVVAVTIKALLERSGYRVKCCANGTEALAELNAETCQFSMVITDFNMPDMSGLTVAQRVIELCPLVPVIITSGYVTEELQEHAKTLGVSAVLLKQYSLERLGPLVRGILQGS